MTPVPLAFPWFTTDLTLGYVHKVTSKDDGAVRYVVMFPKTWEKIGPKEERNVLSGPVMIQNYRVLTWDEQELQLVPKS